ncbi:MAG: hypothetical protein ACXAEX_13905 [Promethearchaeota archaeon]|jgi:hypothetical protein
MKEEEKENLFITFQITIESIIADKRKNPKNEKQINEFNARINLGLQIDKDIYFWLNLIADKGNYALNKGKIDEYDLEIRVTPEDLLYFSNGENSILNMMMKKNKFGLRKLRFSKGSSGKRNLGMLLKLSKIIVLD